MGRVPPAGPAKPGFNIAIITIVALHVVFFGGLLLQGCGRGGKDQPPPLVAGLTNLPPFPEALTGMVGQAYPETTNLAGLTTPADHLSFTSPPPPAPRDATPTNLWATPAPDRAAGFGAPARTEVFEPPVLPPPLKEYKIAKGDNPTVIARKHGVTLEQLREANPEMRDRDLRVGQPLQIPPAARQETASAAGQTSAAPAGVTVYQVKAGDNLTKIAKAHGTTVKAIRSFNDLKTDRIVVNQKLRIPPAETNTPPSAPRL